jgi:hydrogenase maturation protein HypF
MVMRTRGRILVRGIVQGVGFRPFVYAQAVKLGIRGTVKNLGSEVEIKAGGERLPEFVTAVSRGPPLARIDSVQVLPFDGDLQDGFEILPSAEGARTGMIPADIAICGECIADIRTPGGRYQGYWATSCVNCGPRYSIIEGIPYDRERTSMTPFPICPGCRGEYTDPASRRHHAQTIACADCGPALSLLDRSGMPVPCGDPVRETARLLDTGSIAAIRGIGGFHLACIEDSAPELKRRLGRTEQPFAVMVRPEIVERIARVSDEERSWLTGPERPIAVLEKRDHGSHAGISNLHTIGCMLPYTGLHHLIFSHLMAGLLIMTSANMPGYPMITETADAIRRLRGDADFFLIHNRAIVNRCDDSVVREGYIIRMSRGLAPKRTPVWLGDRCILGVGPELNANATIYKDGFAVTSPHVGNVRNPPTLGYLQETVEKIGRLLGARYDLIAHDLHPQFLSTRFARELAGQCGAELVPVQHHRAHIAAATAEPCVGIAIDGVGYGDDRSVWGGEIFAGQVPDLDRVAHLETVLMPGGDLATRFPERMLYGILPGEEVLSLLAARGWGEIEIGVLKKQVATGFNVAGTTSTGRVLDAASALLGICRERTYDGEPAMKLESVAASGKPGTWDLAFGTDGDCATLSTRALMKTALRHLAAADSRSPAAVAGIAASFQYNLARGIAELAVRAAEDRKIPTVVLSGGVAYNHAVRETIRSVVKNAGLRFLINEEYPLGDGCISYGQCIFAGIKSKY